MGKASDRVSRATDGSQPATPLGEAASSISMHSTSGTTTHNRPPSGNAPQYFDDDPAELHGDDLPPLYSDHDLDVSPGDPLIPRGTPGLAVEPWRSSSTSGKSYFIDARLDNDPEFLRQQLEILAESPPRPLCHIRGTHTETRRRRNDDRDEQETVVDFDVEIELTSLLYTDIHSQQSWRRLTSVGNFEKVRRGTVLAKRAAGFGGSGHVAESGTPSVEEWCHRYCASSAGLKSFAMERRVTGWDFEHLRRKLERLVRDTHYEGHLRVSFPVHNSRVEIYNDCRTSRWRLTRWISIVCYVTLLFLCTWPWLFLRTKRFETVYVAWPLRDERSGRYASLSEDQWYNMWARAIQTAVLSGRQAVLSQRDLQLGEPPAATGLAGVLQASVDAMSVMDRAVGWGRDQRGRGRFNVRSGLPNMNRSRC